MFTIGVATVELYLPGNGSLKGKRAVVRPIITRLRNEFNVSVAEVAAQDLYQRAVIAITCVNSDADHVHSVLMKAIDTVERMRLDAEVVDYEIELIQ